MKVRILQKFYDKVEGVYYDPSSDFVEVKGHVAKRLKELGEKVAIFEEKKVDDKPRSVKVKAKD